MTDIEFHVNTADKLLYSCRLLRKAWRQGVSLVVTAEPALLEQLDQSLWSFSSTDFLPHCRSDSTATALAMTPILLTAQPGACEPRSVLVNLGKQVPAGFERYERFIEVACSAEEDLLAARGRWKYYKDRGYSLRRYESSVAAETA